MSDRFHWARLLAFVTGLVNQELLLCNEYLAAENRVLRAHLPSRLRGTQSPAGYRAHCQAGHHPRLVSTLGGPEVRWILGSCLSRPPSGPSGGGGSRGLLGARKP